MQINVNRKYCYRIFHRDNLQHILRDGICTKHHPKASADFVSIGNPEIIESRDSAPVKIDGYGNIGDYVPFYFTPKSIMLYNIITGYYAPLVPKRQREEIIVVRCLIKTLSEVERFFFTNGQANVKGGLTKHYNELSNLSNVDWQII